ncbi:MAG: glycosyltransferase family 9 protein [Bacteroidaceae bacterium]|nr:glycosyltransferase family 9 protein [Bacteroidaceae bacterium]
MAQRSNTPGRTILITRFSAVGDIAMTIPLLYSLCEQYPNDRFIFVSRERFGQFFIDKPCNLCFKGIDLNNYKGPTGLFRLYRELKSEKPDYFADLHDVLRTKILRTYFALFGHTKVRCIDKGRSEKRALTQENGKPKKQLKSTFERYRDVFTRLGFPFTPNFNSLFKEGKGNISEFNTLLPAKGADKWIGIAPFARHEGKIYPLERMEKLVELLSAQSGIKLIFFGNGPREEKTINAWCKKYANTVSFIGKSNFNGELRLISHLDAMICMDSANMHMASLAGVPAISIWGATSPLAGFLGWKQRREDCIELPLACRPCSVFGNKPCKFGDYRCMAIDPQEIATRVFHRIGIEQQ